MKALHILALTFVAISAALGLEQMPAGVVAIHAADAAATSEDEGQPVAASGVTISADGLVLTLEEALLSKDAAVSVTLPGGARRSAQIIARGTHSSALLLQLELAADEQLAVTPLANSASLTIGSEVWTAGNSFGSIERDGQAALSRGIISGRYTIPEGSPPVRGKRGTVLSTYRGPVLETDAAVNDGNQGGALLDKHGKLLGLVSLGVAHQRKVGTAIPINIIAADFPEYLPPVSDLPASDTTNAVGTQFAGTAKRISRSVVLCYVERPNGPGNGQAVPRPAPITSALPRYQKQRLEDQWNQWYHFQQVAYTDQAVPAVIIDAEGGLLLTAASNLHGDAESGVVLAEGIITTSRRWTVLSRHVELDLAVLQCDGPLEGDSIRFEREPELSTGDPVAVIGRHRDGGPFTMTAGVVSATDRRARSSEFGMHQTDAWANYGSLGGPVIDLDDTVVGLVTMLGPGFDWGINSGVAIFIDSATLLAVLPDLANGTSHTEARIVGLGIRHGWEPGTSGVPIDAVIPNSGAAEAGIQEGDIIRQVSGRVIDNPQDLNRALVRHRRGDQVDVVIERDGAEQTIAVTLDILPTDNEEKSQQEAPASPIESLLELIPGRDDD